MRVAIVTFEYTGITRNGGIGTAFGALGDLLSQQGHEVTVFFVPLSDLSPERRSALRYRGRTVLEKKGIEFKLVSKRRTSKKGTPRGLLEGQSVCQELLRQKEPFDVIHFHDHFGFAHSTLLAKKRGGKFQSTVIAVGLHGPYFWTPPSTARTRRTRSELAEIRLEKESIQMADVLLSPSAYMVRYIAKAGCLDPKDSRIRVIPNVNRLSKVSRRPKVQKPSIRRIAFYGRIEPRKGIHVFVEALRLLSRKKTLSQVEEVVFLGKDTFDRLERSQIALASRALSGFPKNYRLKFITYFDSEQCRDYFVRNPDTLVVMPSLVDNSPYCLVECLEQDIDFISSDSGGQPELLRKGRTGARHLCRPEAGELARAIEQKLTQKTRRLPDPSSEAIHANRAWIEFHRSLDATKRQTRSAP